MRTCSFFFLSLSPLAVKVNNVHVIVVVLDVVGKCGRVVEVFVGELGVVAAWGRVLGTSAWRCVQLILNLCGGQLLVMLVALLFFLP